jgi:hypothetical protein
MAIKDVHEFASDRPIACVKDDLLGRASFAMDLADAISSWHGNDSLVVALNGDWGSGKSSIKNMAVSILESKDINKPDIIDFSPWEWAAQEKITASFFNEISKSIGKKDRSKSGKKLAAALKRYGQYLNTGESIVSGISAALPTLFILATIVGIGGSIYDEKWIKTTSLTLLSFMAFWATILKWGSKFLKNLGGNFEAIAKEKERGLSDIRKELKDLLSERSNSLVVVMDDLDRLTTDQLRMVFQLVKANVEFPNVVFLLLFQRDLVEEKLSDGKQLGCEYLEKIIQVPFDIPKLETSRLHGLLFSKLDNILEQNHAALQMFDAGYWGNIFHGSLCSYFNNLRDVYRYTSTLSFHFSLLRGKGAFEVNPVDLMAVECIRLFEPRIYKELCRSKGLFTGHYSERYGKSKDDIKEVVNNVFNKATDGKKEIIKRLLQQLFPDIGLIINSIDGHSLSFDGAMLKEMRICHYSNYDKYFQFAIPDGDVSNSDLKEMLSLTSEAIKLSSFILSLKERGIIENGLARLFACTEDIPIENGYEYLKGLLDVGDIVGHSSYGYTYFDSHSYLVSSVIQFLRRIDNVDNRSALLLRCFKDSKGISVVERILQKDENHRTKSIDEIIFSDFHFDLLKNEFVYKLEYMADNSPLNLIGDDHFASFLFRWQRWGDADKLLSWLYLQTDNAKGCVDFLKAFLTQSSITQGGDYVAKMKYIINIDDIEQFLPVDRIIMNLKDIDIKSLDDNAKITIDAFNNALKERENVSV